MADQKMPRQPRDQRPPEASRSPDYPLADSLELTEPGQYAALFEPTRNTIISILSERAATTSELAAVLDKPKGTVGHHLKVLEAAGLVAVVRTERVRALEAKYYGRTAGVFLYHREHDAIGQEQRVLGSAAQEIGRTPAHAASTANIRYLRIPDDQAARWRERVNDLIQEFADQPVGGETTYALVVGLYGTDRTPLPEPALPEHALPEQAHPEPGASSS